MKKFKEILDNAWAQSQSLLCVGLDPDPKKIPSFLGSGGESFLKFNKEIIDCTSDLVCAYKPQIAFYSAIGAEKELRETIEYIRVRAPHALVILDAKRGDIGNTAEAYAKEAFERYEVDCVTVNPYMGLDTLVPFLSYKDKGAVVLCKTSNPGSGDFQDLEVNGIPLYQKIAQSLNEKFAAQENMLFVVGATYPSQIKVLREMAPTVPFLVPGIGAQGGDLEQVLRNGLNSRGDGLIINSSRQILYASSGADFAESARREAMKLRDDINSYRK